MPTRGSKTAPRRLQVATEPRGQNPANTQRNGAFGGASMGGHETCEGCAGICDDDDDDDEGDDDNDDDGDDHGDGDGDGDDGDSDDDHDYDDDAYDDDADDDDD